MHEQEHWEEKGKKDDGTRLEEFESHSEYLSHCIQKP